MGAKRTSGLQDDIQPVSTISLPARALRNEMPRPLSGIVITGGGGGPPGAKVYGKAIGVSLKLSKMASIATPLRPVAVTAAPKSGVAPSWNVSNRSEGTGPEGSPGPF